MALPLMPKATAVWLVENTSLSFDQIGEFCGLHPLEVQAIADGEVAIQMQGLDPVANGQVTLEEIERCQQDPAARLKLAQKAVPVPVVKHRGPRYTPIAKRQDKPDAISWLTKNHPELSDGQISKVLGAKCAMPALMPRAGSRIGQPMGMAPGCGVHMRASMPQAMPIFSARNSVHPTRTSRKVTAIRNARGTASMRGPAMRLALSSSP